MRKMVSARVRGARPGTTCLFVLGIAAVACSTDVETIRAPSVIAPVDTRTDTPMPRDAKGLPIDVSAVIRHVHFAFREDARGFHGGHSTYEVHVNRTGIDFASAVPGADGASTRVSAPLRLHTASIERGGRTLLDPNRGPAIAEDGALVWKSASPYVTERLRNDEDGPEQTWDVPVQPAGEGDVVVRIAVTGQRYVTTTATGLHFADPSSGLGTRYGDVAWIDARGARTPLTPRFENGFIELRIPHGVIERSHYPAVLDPVLGPEVGTDTPVAAVSFEDQNTPVVARSSSGFLVVWDDRRGGNGDIYGTRVLSDGTVLDPKGLLISSAIGGQTVPAIASNGTDFLVAWMENGNGNDVFGLRIAGASGAKIDAAPIAITAAGGNQTNPAIAFDGTNYLVAWQDRRGASDAIYARRVKPSDGSLLDGTSGTGGFVVSDAANRQQAPAIACDAARCLVAWQDDRNTNNDKFDIYAARIEIASGSVLDPSGIGVSTEAENQSAPQVATDGTSFAVIWQDDRASNTNIHAARVDSAAGTLTDGPAASGGVTISSAAGAQIAPAIMRAGSQYFAVWQDARGSNQDVYAARLGDNLVPVDATGVQLTSAGNTQSRPRVAFDGTNALVVWQDRRTGLNNDVVGRRVTVATMALSDGDLSTGGIQLTGADNTQRRPSVATDGTNALVVWQDNRSPAPDIYGVRIALATGTVLDPNGLAIATAAGNQQAPSATFGGGQYFVVWQDRRGSNDDIYGRRIQPDGTLLDGASTAGLAIVTATGDQTTPRVAFSSANNNYLVAWHSGGDIRGRRVSTAAALSDGAVNTTGIAISSAQYEQTVPAVASNGTDYLVTWQDRRDDNRAACGNQGDPPCPQGNICSGNVCRNDNVYGARIVGADGTVQDATGFAISTAANLQLVPQVTFGSGQYYVVWQDRRATGSSDDIYGARVATNGTVPDGAPNGVLISNAVLTQSNPAVTWTGTHYLATWTDQRIGILDLYAGRIGTNGALVDTPTDKGGFAVSAETAPEDFSAVVGTGSGNAFVAYQRLGAGGAIRVFGRTVGFVAQGGDCTTLADCATGFCADGKCCNTACGGGVASDCVACSAAAGSSTDGTCETIAAAKAYACRPSKEATCDPAEVCNGTDTSCPTDSIAANGTACGNAGQCDAGACIEPTPPPLSGPDAAIPFDAGGTVTEGGTNPTGEGGTESDAGGDAATSSGGPPKEDDGCGCRTAGHAPMNRTAAFAGVLILLGAVARRRDKRARSEEKNVNEANEANKEAR